jgi:hypothetical protein
MNVPDDTCVTPPPHVPSGPGRLSPHAVTTVGTSLKSTPPWRQIVFEPPGGIVVVVLGTSQIGAGWTSGAEGPESGQTPGEGEVGFGFGQIPATGPYDTFGFGQTPGTGPGDGLGFGHTPGTGVVG